MNTMLKLTPVILLISSLGACSTISKVDQAVAWAQQKFDKVDAAIEDAKEFSAEKIAKIEADQAEFEKITGAWDKDGDGYFDVPEAKTVVKEIVSDPKKWELLFNADLWMAILGALGLSAAARKGINLRKKAKQEHDLDRYQQAKTAAQEVISGGSSSGSPQ